ncbi:DNA polymerase (family 10) [Fodinibius sediminis]|uniref:DNA polymerase (Family 10) n=1 Tax=Fodinibius sediminis TaxID=1214077 RepID=A0A521CG93_9BACT|nr:DNA polymerase (family 10) [Fodinibius sediminis]
MTTRGELKEALESGKVEELKGFGEKSVENLLEGLKEKEKADRRILLAEALEISEMMLNELEKQKSILRLEVAGSIRRKKETIGDIDILATADSGEWASIADFFTSMESVTKVIARGETKSSVIVEHHDRQVDLRLIEEDAWGAALLYFTGSKEHNIQLRKIAKDKGFKISEYGMFTVDDDEKVAGKTEEELYDQLGMQWIPPEMRENNGEIELARKDALPELVQGEHIKGDMHFHSDWSDGTNSLEELARYLDEHYPYDYAVVSDHSKSSRIAGGLTGEEFEKQFEEIEQVNDAIGRPLLKRGVEVDILADGSLDLDNGLLEKMEWVTASIHSRFNQDNTERILKACENPFVNVIGHLTGRLIGKRREYAVDLEKVIHKARETGTALEINAQPERMDLNDDAVRAAREAGVLLVAGTDSHDLSSFQYMDLAISIARRGWCTAKNMLNTRSWEEVQAFVKQKRDQFLSPSK